MKFIDLRFERCQVVRFRKQEGKTFHQLHVLGMNDDLWDKVREMTHGLPFDSVTIKIIFIIHINMN